MKSLFFLLGCLTFSVTAFSSELINSNTRVENIFSSLGKSMLQCSDKVWPNYNWVEYQTLLIDDEKQKAWVWDGSTQAVLETPYNQLPSTLKDTDYAEGDLNGRYTIMTSLDKSYEGTIANYGESTVLGLDVALDTLIHEGFHFTVQARDDWAPSQGQPVRGDVYPKQWEPRYLRRMMFESQKFALLNPVQVDRYIGEAAFWFNRWKEKYPMEYINSLDRDEGSAEYVEAVAAAYSHLGCDATTEQILNFYRERVEASFKITEKLDLEAYSTGKLAGLLLEQKSVPGWKERVQKGESLLDVLFSTVTSVQAKDNYVLRNEISSSITVENEELKISLGDSIDRMKASDFVRVSIPNTWKQAVMHVKAFLLPIEIENSFIIFIANDFSFTQPDGPGVVATTGEYPFFVKLDNPCEGGGMVFTLPKAELNSDGFNTIDYSSQRIKVRAEFSKVNSLDKGWICLK